MSAFPLPDWAQTAVRAHYAHLAAASPLHSAAPTSAEELADRAAILGVGPERSAAELPAANARAVGRALLRRSAERAASRYVYELRFGGGEVRVPRGVVEVVEAVGREPATQRRLAERLGRSPAAVCRQLAEAERLGRVTRPQDPAKGVWRLAERQPFFAPPATAQDRLSAAIAALGPDATAAAIARHAGISARHVRRLRSGR